MLSDPVASALTKIKNAETASKKECVIGPASKLLGEVLRVAKEGDYISNFELLSEKGKRFYKVELSGKINACKAVKPRFAVKKDEFERYEKRYLPARDVGIIVVSTSSGVMNHNESKAKNLGGRLVAYFF
jgi:small subunit ribosomal protein S8